jgi:hypothetical protein
LLINAQFKGNKRTIINAAIKVNFYPGRKWLYRRGGTVSFREKKKETEIISS